MDDHWLDDYVAAWRDHPRAGGPDGDAALERLLRFMSPTVLYEDVPTGSVFHGHPGIRQMSRSAHAMSPDMDLKIVSHFLGGDCFAFEVLVHGSNTGEIGPLPGTGSSFEFRSVSVGTVSSDGLVVAQRDYWDLAGLLGQLSG